MRNMLLLLLFLGASYAGAYPLQSKKSEPQNVTPSITEGVGFDQRLDASVPGQATFRDESGAPVTFAQYLGKRPVLLAMIYYGCPNLCTRVISGLFKALEDLRFSAGKEFDVVLVSIDPKETSALAAQKKKAYLARYGRDGAEQGLHFLTGDEASIAQLAKAVGFRYRYDEATQQYAHPGGLIVLTPQGHVSRYLYGIEYPNKDLRLALTEASANKIGSLTDKFLLLCFHYDPATGRYSLAVLKALKVVGFLTASTLALGIGFMLMKERRKRLTAESPA